MGSVTLRPNSSRDARFFDIGGGITNTHWGTVADNSDNSWLGVGTTGQASVALGFPDPVLPAGAVVTSVTAYMRIQAIVAGAFVNGRLHQPYPATYTVISFAEKAPTTITTRKYGPLVKQPNGSPWTLAAANALVLQPMFNQYTRLYDAWLVVSYNERPTTTVTSPSGSLTTTVRPVIEWTYSDPEFDPQERYWVKVFNAAQYGAAGFNPETSPTVWGSGAVMSDALQVQVGLNLVNGTTYRAYVKTGDKGSGGRYSPWAFSQFTVNVVVPATPTVAIESVDLDTASALVTVAGGTSGRSALVERSDDDGASWVQVRGTAELTFGAGGTAAITDYEAPPNTPVRYRATQAYTLDGNVFASPPSATVTVTVPSDKIRFKDPLRAERSIVISQRGNITFDRDQPTGIFAPFDRGEYVVVKGTSGGVRFDLELNFRDEAEWRAFSMLRESGDTVLFQMDSSVQFYVRFGAERPVTLHSTQARRHKPFRTVTLTCYQVSRP